MRQIHHLEAAFAAPGNLLGTAAAWVPLSACILNLWRNLVPLLIHSYPYMIFQGAVHCSVTQSCFAKFHFLLLLRPPDLNHRRARFD